MKKVILWTSLTAFFISLLQTAVFSHISFFPIMPEFILLLILYTGISNGSMTGLVCGFISGLFLDFLSAAPIGLHSFIFTLLGFISGKIYGLYNLNKIIFTCLLGTAVFLFYAVILFVLRFLFGQNIHIFNLITLDFLIRIR
ncbi:rod shape-determining protein MreD [Treponema pedis]|uniref:rod shape-determining protein MreD n=1 Tax=Treponema pedis TaxID=409322 RepID=UPI0003F9EF67|nr:rod shape-determining protein MreD [Treponema pedis]